MVRLLKSMPQLARLATRLSSTHVTASSGPINRNEIIKYVDEHNYVVKTRPVSHDDLMEPYGSFEVALEAERRLGNKTLLRGIFTFVSGCMFFYYLGVMDELWMPNLDNIMEETEPFVYNKEGRFTPK